MTSLAHFENHNLQGLFGVGRVRDRLSGPAAVQAAITEAVHRYIAGIEEIDSADRKVLVNASQPDLVLLRRHEAYQIR